MTTTVSIDSHLQSNRDAEVMRSLFIEAAETADVTLTDIIEKLTLGGCCRVHLLLAGFEEDGFWYTCQLGTPREEKTDSARGVYLAVAKRRAEMQAQNKTAIVSYVPSEYERHYPEKPGSAWHAGISVGVASDRPDVDAKIAGLYAVLVYDAWKEAMQAADFDKKQVA